MPSHHRACKDPEKIFVNMLLRERALRQMEELHPEVGQRVRSWLPEVATQDPHRGEHGMFKMLGKASQPTQAVVNALAVALPQLLDGRKLANADWQSAHEEHMDVARLIDESLQYPQAQVEQFKLTAYGVPKQGSRPNYFVQVSDGHTISTSATCNTSSNAFRPSSS